MNNGPKK